MRPLIANVTPERGESTPVNLAHATLPSRSHSVAGRMAAIVIAAGLLPISNADAQSKSTPPTSTQGSRTTATQKGSAIASQPSTQPPKAASQSTGKSKTGDAKNEKPTLGNSVVRRGSSRSTDIDTIRILSESIYSAVATDLQKLSETSAAADVATIQQGMKQLRSTRDVEKAGRIYSALAILLTHSEDLSPSKFEARNMRVAANRIRELDRQPE